jgi:lipopolysaccharide export system protein LptA
LPGVRAKYLKLFAITLESVLIIFAFSISSYAGLEDISFTADHQRQIKEDNVTLLTGNVHITYTEYNFWADEVHFNKEKKEFYGVGNVHILGSDREIFADSFWYNYDRDEFRGTNAKGKISVGSVSEPVHFVCKEIKGTLKVFKLISTSLTTCEPDESQEYHIEAGMVKILMDNKVVMRNAVVYLGQVPIFWFPFYMYSLKETPYEIQVGKTKAEGKYVKIKYNYLYATNIYGSLSYHYLSKLGMKFIADHAYYLQGQGEGATYISVAANRYTQGGGTDISFKTSQKFKFSPQFYGDISLTQNKDVDVISGKSNNTFSSRISLTSNTPGTNTGMNFNYNSQVTPTQTSASSTSSLSHRRQWKKQNMDLNMTFNLNRQNTTREDENGSLADDQELSSTLSLNKRKELYDWQLKIDKKDDLDGSNYAGDTNRSYFDRMPEIVINLDPGIFDSDREREYKEGKEYEGFQMRRIELKGALYYEGPKDKEVQGFFGKFQTEVTRDFPIDQKNRFTTAMNYMQNITSTGDALYSFSPRIGLKLDFSEKLKMNIDWNKSESNGRSPFRQESGLGNSNNFRWDMNYNGKKWTHRWSTGYNLQNDQWQSITHNSTYNKGNFKYNMSTAYNLEQSTWSPLNNTFNWQNNRTYSTNFSLIFNLEDNKITTFTNDTKLLINDEWDLGFKAQYSGGGSKGSIIREVYLNKNFDCTYISFSYDAASDAFTATFGITAYPSASYTYRSNNQGLRNTFPGFGGGLDFSGSGFGGLFGGGGGYSGDYYSDYGGGSYY